MSLSIQFTSEEEALLEAASRQSTRSKSELVRQGARELCRRLLQQDRRTPYQLGEDLFGVGRWPKRRSTRSNDKFGRRCVPNTAAWVDTGLVVTLLASNYKFSLIEILYQQYTL